MGGLGGLGSLGGLGALGVWAGRRSCQGGSHPLGVVSVFICPGWGKSPKEELREIVRQRLVSSRRWAVKARSRGPAGDSTGCHRAPATSEDPRPQQSRCGSGPGVLWRGHTWHVQTLPADGLLLWPGPQGKHRAEGVLRADRALLFHSGRAPAAGNRSPAARISSAFTRWSALFRVALKSMTQHLKSLRLSRILS